MKKKNIKNNPKARNNNAHASFQSYFDRISNSLDDRIGEYMQMKKFVRVYEESNKLLDIDKTINTAAGSIYEINLEGKVNIANLKKIIQSLAVKNKVLRAFIQKNKLEPLQLKLLTQILKNSLIITNNLQKVYQHINKINEIVPVVKAILKLPEQEDNYENDPVLLEISEILSTCIDNPAIKDITLVLKKQKIDPSKYSAKFNFEDMNDVSDKLVGLLNDKLLVIINVSEFLIANVEDDGANDVSSDKRIPEEIRTLFLAASILNILYRIKELKSATKVIFNGVKLHNEMINSSKLQSHYKGLLKSGNDSIHNNIYVALPTNLQRFKKTIVELIPHLDAFQLKLKLDSLDIEIAMKMAYSLMYEKTNRMWENPYD
ncbi:MAG: hypothetical protein KAH84_09990 [Thiomargarita sp.]|nr:hypothetical protein [Thiomargarita sp.]